MNTLTALADANTCDGLKAIGATVQGCTLAYLSCIMLVLCLVITILAAHSFCSMSEEAVGAFGVPQAMAVGARASVPEPLVTV